MLPGILSIGRGRETYDSAVVSESKVAQYGPWSKFSFGMGGFFAGYDSGIALGADNLGLGVIIDIEDAQGAKAQATDFVAPLPLAGLRTVIRLTPKLELAQITELLYISFAGVEGRLVDLSIMKDYSLTRKLDLGLGVNSNRIAVLMVEDKSIIDFFGDIRMAYNGAMVYAKISF